MREVPEISDERKIYLLEKIVTTLFGCKIDWKRGFGYESFHLKNLEYSDKFEIRMLNKIRSSFDISLKSRGYLVEQEDYGTQIVTDIDAELEESFESKLINNDKFRKDIKEWDNMEWTEENEKKCNHNWVKEGKGVLQSVPYPLPSPKIPSPKSPSPKVPISDEKSEEEET